MKVKKINLWTRLNSALKLLFRFFRTNAFFNNNKKQFYLPMILMLFLFSCKKENDLIIPNQEQSTEQAKTESCGTTEYLKQQLVADPGLRIRMDAIEHNLQSRISMRNAEQRSSAVVTIPVVVHVVYNLAEQNISDLQVQSQIDALTEDFTKTNADAATIPTAFQPFAANANIQFVLAKRDPGGNATNGITRTFTSNTSFSANNYVKFASYGGHDAWPTDQYLNIWVCNLGLCGYASYPGSPTAVDGVVVKFNCFGRTGSLQTNYNKGRTATHEVSHWLNVHHIWGDATCGDDLAGDTPTQENANYDHPAFPLLSSCSPNSNGDMFMNYMDYTADEIRTMMTQGQVDRMNATLDGPRASILTSLGATAPSGGGTVCNAPTGLNPTLITSNSCKLNWSASGAASYSVRYKSTASSTWITSSASSTSLAISGLSSSASYEFQVASVCSATVTSVFSSSSMFTTLVSTTPPPCSIPSGLSASFITKNSAKLNWSSTGGSTYNVRYKSAATTAWIYATVTSTSLSISGLSSFTGYEFQVASVCSGTVSSYSLSKLFRTKKGGK